MNTLNFTELSEDGLYCVNGGIQLGNALMFAGGAIALCASGPVALVVGIFMIITGLGQSEGW